MQQQQHMKAIMNEEVKTENTLVCRKLRLDEADKLFCCGVVCFIFTFNLFIPALHRSRSWHLFSNQFHIIRNTTFSWLPVGYRAYSLATS